MSNISVLEKTKSGPSIWQAVVKKPKSARSTFCSLILMAQGAKRMIW